MSGLQLPGVHTNTLVPAATEQEEEARREVKGEETIVRMVIQRHNPASTLEVNVASRTR